MAFTATEIIGLSGVAVVVIAAGWAISRLDNRLGEIADDIVEKSESADDEVTPAKRTPKGAKKRRR